MVDVCDGSAAVVAREGPVPVVDRGPCGSDDHLMEVVVRVGVVVCSGVVVEVFVAAEVCPGANVFEALPEEVAVGCVVADAVPDHLEGCEMTESKNVWLGVCGQLFVDPCLVDVVLRVVRRPALIESEGEDVLVGYRVCEVQFVGRAVLWQAVIDAPASLAGNEFEDIVPGIDAARITSLVVVAADDIYSDAGFVERLGRVAPGRKLGFEGGLVGDSDDQIACEEYEFGVGVDDFPDDLCEDRDVYAVVIACTVASAIGSDDESPRLLGEDSNGQEGKHQQRQEQLACSKCRHPLYSILLARIPPGLLHLPSVRSPTITFYKK